jgi:predicted TIM-barrel fold metal-dependent hydrolase
MDRRSAVRQSSTPISWPHPYLVISVDDHLIEPPDLFDRRVPTRWADEMPSMTTLDHGGYGWVYEGELRTSYGIEAVAGRPKEEWTILSQPFEALQPAYFDADARAEAMDADGIWASVCFPSMWCGFAGRVFQTSRDRELGLECIRAYNRWYLEEWVGRQPDRFIPMQLPWIVDPAVGANEIRRNAERGFKAVSLTDQPQCIGFPHMSDSYWDPILQACEETQTVVCLHCGSGGWTLTPEGRNADLSLAAWLFQPTSMVVAADWVAAGVPLRFPGLKISLSEGGCGWVPMLLERIRYVLDHSGHAEAAGYHGADVTPAEALLRNFWFCTIHDKAAMAQRDLIGVPNVMVETDYPHTDGLWPHTQSFYDGLFAGVPRHEVASMTYGNAAELFGHPLPTTQPLTGAEALR